MRFLANMGISPMTVEWLHTLGHEAIHLHELGFDRWADSDILSKAREEGWIVLTSDLDFGDLLAASRDALPSVVIFRLRDMRPDRVNAHLLSLFEQHSEDLVQGVISVSQNENCACGDCRLNKSVPVQSLAPGLPIW